MQEGSSATIAERVYVHGGRVDEWRPLGKDDIDGKPGGRVSGRRASQIVASWGNGQWHNHHYDARGHCILLSTTTGGIMVQFDYDAFGWPYFYNAAGGKGSAALTRFLFTGREWIKDLRLYDYRARMYQPELGRFLQPDPIQFAAGDYNLYRYCHNDPVNRNDPFGLVDQKIDKEVDQWGSKASINSLKEAKKDSVGRSQAVQEKGGKLSVGSRFGKGEPEVQQKHVQGRLQPITTQKEHAPLDDGHNPVAVGHAHMDKTGGAKPEFTDADYTTAQGSAQKPGMPVYKVNESNPKVILRLTPQVNYQDRPEIRQVSP